ncbi:poly(U)-binding-splicing factor PUF60-like isoform X1 [Clytia hemisphaerica]|uniref:RRM domain-containing protein n=2 Tax=Clytia hemisphaerica TaxID=252671 RepID=A0A7M5WJH8_9CNID|eukprot:TCONS_00033900-protein
MEVDTKPLLENTQSIAPTNNDSTPTPPVKRKRRNMFDVKPEELGMEAPKPVNSVVPLTTNQPKDDGKGDLLLGIGGGGLQARFSEAKKALPKILREQEEKLALAKRFAMEQSVQHVLSKQKIVAAADLNTVQSTAQRTRALALMCRIYIGSINFELNEESIRASFIPFGPIKMIDLSWDAATGRHKGFAFVEYELPEAAQLALEQMNNVMMGGRNIKVGRPSNVPQAAPWIDQILEEARAYARIYVSSIHPDLTEVDIKSVFEAFGIITECTLTPDQLTGKHKGYGFIEYSTQQSANDAIVAMNLFDLGGQYIRVGRAITPPATTGEQQQQGPPPSAAILAANVISATLQGQEVVSSHGASVLLQNPINHQQIASSASLQPQTVVASTAVPTPQVALTNPISNGVPQMTAQPVASMAQPTPPTATSNGTAPRNQPVPEEKLTASQSRAKQELMDHKAAGEGNLEREEKLEISGKDARYMMMQKLARQSASAVIVLRNMVSVEEVDEDLEEEINEECSRFGEVKRVIIYQEKQGEEENAEVIVKIFVEFSKSEEAEGAQSALNGRWFGGRSIQCHVYDDVKYQAQDYTA